MEHNVPGTVLSTQQKSSDLILTVIPWRRLMIKCYFLFFISKNQAHGHHRICLKSQLGNSRPEMRRLSRWLHSS